MMLCSDGFAGRSGASSENVALVREAEISARISKVLRSGEVATSMCFADRGSPQCPFFGLCFSPSFFDLLLPQ